MAGVGPINLNKLKTFSGKVFLVTIGIDNYSDGITLQYAQSDADNFEKYISSDTLTKELNKYSFRDFSNKSDIKLALNNISENSRADDLFILYFAGMSENGHFILSNDTISAKEIYYFSQNIYSENQLFIIDANEGDLFIDNLKSEFQSKQYEKGTTQINRVVIAIPHCNSEGDSLTNCNPSYKGGFLTSLIISSSESVIRFMLNSFNDRSITLYKSAIYKCMVYKDKDLLLFSELLYRQEFIRPEIARSVVIENVNPLNNAKNNLIIRKGETLCILVGNQNFVNLPRLPNVMNDVEKINSILIEKYKTQTFLLKDITYQSFCDTLYFIKKAYTFEEGSQILFIAASHGVTDKFGIGYLCFNDTKNNDFMTSSYEMQNIKKVISQFGATNTLMLMDICHSGLAFDNCKEPTTGELSLKNPIYTSPFNQNSPAYVNYLNQVTNLYFGSSSGKQVAADGMGSNSPFAKAVISFLESNQLPVIDSYYLQKSIQNNKAMSEEAISKPIFCSYNCQPDGRFLFIKK
jgi:hypothetical protein